MNTPGSDGMVLLNVRVPPMLRRDLREFSRRRGIAMRRFVAAALRERLAQVAGRKV